MLEMRIRGTKPLLILILLYATSFRLLTLDRPFDYDDEATGGAFYGIMARNYLRFPWAETHALPVITVGRLPGVPPVFYADHPPLVPLLIAPVYKLFDFGDWQTRLPTSTATIVAIWVLYLLLKRFGNERIALVAAALFAAMPMTLYFGGQPEVLGMPLVLFALVTVFAYLNFHASPGVRTFVSLLAAFTLAAISDWPAFILVPVLLAHFGGTKPRRQWVWIIAFAAYACIVFALLSIYIGWAAHLPWNWIVPLFQGRAALGVTAPFTAHEWVRSAWAYNAHHHTILLLAASSLWLLRSSVRPGRPQPGTTVARLLLAWGFLHVIIGRQGVYLHEWWWWPLTPGIACASALLVDWMIAATERRGFRRIGTVTAGIAISLFAVWTAGRVHRELYPWHQSDPFTTMDLGRAIRAAAPGPNDLAMLAWSGNDPELWFYGDRALRADIWSIEDFTSRVNDRWADLVFRELQPWPAPAAGIVFPAFCRSSLPDLYAYLRERYPLTPLAPDLGERFEVFDLRRPLARGDAP